jgi:WD40 repeat protein/serine/threonine protein kinase
MSIPHEKAPSTGTPPSGDIGETLVPPSDAAPLPDEPAAQRIAGYEILGELGRGGMGVVYKARQQGLDRVVALKMILHADHAGKEDRARFEREAKALAGLRHEGIVGVYEVGEHQGKPFFSLEYVEGGSLDKHLAGTPLPPRQAARLVQQLAQAMQAAHEAGIIHRDLKPANVLLAVAAGLQPADSAASQSAGCKPAATAGWLPKITDFGLAKKQDEGGLSVSGAVMGTPSYMAPEQAAGKGKQIDARTDIYALGALLYECLTGRPPFKAATAMDTLLQVLSAEPVTVRSLQPSVPADLETICLKCLQKDPARRYASARELCDDLGRFLRQEPVLARPVGRLERGWRWCRRNPVVASLLAGIALVLASGATVSTVLGQVAWRKSREAQNKAEEAARETKRAQRETLRAQQAEEGQKKKAEEATREAKRARRAEAEERRQRQLAADRLYISRLSLAQSYWQERNVAAAREKLYEAQEHRDTWEHRYLYILMNHRGQRTFPGHTNTVHSVCFSPDGRRIASASWDQTVKVWDVATGQVQLTLEGHSSYVHSVCFSPDGKRLASASFQAVKVWDAATGQQILSLIGHTGGVESVCFSPDGQRIVSGGGGFDAKTRRSWGEVKVWDARTGKEALSLKGHTGDVASVCFSPDGKRLASASRDTTVRVWDAATGQEQLTLKGHTFWVASVCFSPDGQRLASGSNDNTVKVWEAQTGQELLTLKGHTHRVWSVCFSPDGRRLASGSEDGTVRMWEAATGQQAFELTGHTDQVFSVCFSPDGKRLASASDDKTVKVWNAATGQEALALKGHTSEVGSVAFSPDGKHLASASDDNTVKVWDAATGQPLLSLQGHTSGVYSVGFSPDGKRLVSASKDKTVKVWDAHTGRQILSLKGHAGYVTSVAYSPDGKRLASGGEDKTVRVWDAATGQEALSLKGHTDMVTSVCFSPDGKRLASASGGEVMKAGAVKVWNVVMGQQVLELKGHTGAIFSVCFSPDGKRIASGSGDKTVKLWDAATGQEALTLTGHTDPVARVCFSPDGQRLASAGDRTVRVWDAATGQQVLSLKGHTDWVRGVCFSSDGKRLASASDDKTVKVWDAAAGQDWWVGPDYRWHATQAQASWQASDWFAASFHLERCLPERPWDANLHVRHAYALSRLGRTPQAAAHYLQALLLAPHVSPWPRDPYAGSRVLKAAQASDWPHAVADIELAAHQPGATPFDRLLARQAAGPKDRPLSCRELLDRLENDSSAAGMLGFSCRVAPCTEADARRLVKVTQRLVAGRRNASTLDIHGAALYRAGRFEEAARTLQDAIKVHGKGGYVDTWLFLAMAQQRLGQGEAAQESLTRFEGWLKGRKFATWQETTRWHLLHEEARRLVLSMPRSAD